MSKVEIDPEDREQVERLVRFMPEDWNLAGWLDEDPETLADSIAGVATALRHFANPPKPEEPTGLGAVVECDYDGRRGKAVYTGAGWTFYGDHLVDHSADWFAFDAVRVLSEGVAA